MENDKEQEIRAQRVYMRHDGSWRCSCDRWNQTGKTCTHILAAQMQLKLGHVSEYHRQETRLERGKNAAGISASKQASTGRWEQAPYDSTVYTDFNRIMTVLAASGDKDPFEDDINRDKDTSSEDENDGSDKITGPMVPNEQSQAKDLADLKCLHRQLERGRAKKKSEPTLPKGPKVSAFQCYSLVWIFDFVQKKRAEEFSPSRLDAKKTKLVHDDLYNGIELAEAFQSDGADVSRWQQSDYWMQYEEITEAVDIANTISSALGTDSLFMDSHRLGRICEELREIGPDCSHNAVSVPEAQEVGGLYQTILKLLEKTPALRTAYFLHLHGSHYIFWQVKLRPEYSIAVFDSLSSSSLGSSSPMLFDFINNIIQPVTSHFTRISFDQIKQRLNRYKYRSLNIQDDGSACGFWVFAMAILVACGTDLEYEDNIGRMRELGIIGLKHHLMQIWEIWKSSQDGMLLKPVCELVQLIDPFIKLPEDHKIPEIFTRPQKDLGSNEQIEIPTQKTIETFRHSTGIDLDLKMADALWNDEYLPMLHDTEANGTKYVINNSVIDHSTMRRFKKGMWNDEIINCVLDIIRETYGKRGVFLISSLTWKKLEEFILSVNLEDDESWLERLIQLIDRWRDIKNIPWRKMDEVALILVAIHQPSSTHWVVGVADFERKSLSIFQGMITAGIRMNQGQTLDTLYQPCSDDIDWSSWGLDYAPKGQAIQNNATDCGIYAIGNILLLSRSSSQPFNSILTAGTIPLVRAGVYKMIIEQLKQQKKMHSPHQDQSGSSDDEKYWSDGSWSGCGTELSNEQQQHSGETVEDRDQAKMYSPTVSSLTSMNSGHDPRLELRRSSWLAQQSKGIGPPQHHQEHLLQWHQMKSGARWAYISSTSLSPEEGQDGS
ncbi:hypothetical protein K435DRAFT_868812 [Dendrothele bispora CBS 962.96]|uniref:SWIM-type domain-containing protein n=1 Tax=Dendrothele bispora (strain CBS 962.96) TaxID=1314807 RepID=A0A4S8LAQ5_DENBC|nr:hypothetical protein K435DRAFT_868812 [Dendrothele bispora CBS 962.96]